jgi:predicted PurR-regulated permease PerM
VVPFLLACMAYYTLYPLVRRLVFSGFSASTAATLVTLAFALVTAGAFFLATSAFADKSDSWQGVLAHYLEGGRRLLDDTLRVLEHRFDLVRKAHLNEQVRQQVSGYTSDFARSHLVSLIMTAASWLPSLLLAPVISFFLLRDGTRFKQFLLRAVPNAYFERTLHLIHAINQTAKAYFRGMLVLTLLDTLTLATGLWLIGISSPLALGIITAVLAWIPFVGSVIGCVLVVLVAATDFPSHPEMAYSAIALFLLARTLDDFLYMPLTVGRKLKMHPLVTILLIFVGGTIAGVAGLILVLPLAGIVIVLGETLGMLAMDLRLWARHLHGRALRKTFAARDL